MSIRKKGDRVLCGVHLSKCCLNSLPVPTLICHPSQIIMPTRTTGAYSTDSEHMSKRQMNVEMEVSTIININLHSEMALPLQILMTSVHYSENS
jgi:hypothetical protein